MDRLQMAVARARQKKRETGLDQPDLTEQGIGDTEVSNLKVFSEAQMAARRIVACVDSFAESEVFRLLRTKILAQMKANGWRTLAVSSPTLGQGKSTVVANLAVAMAMEVTQSVLAVDLDLRRPNLHKAFGLKAEFGLLDVLQGKAQLGDTLINIGSNRLTLVPGKGSVSNSSEWLSNPSMQSLYSEFRSRSRVSHVIYDMPPLLQSDDVLKSVKNFDCLLLVVEDNRNTNDEVKQSLELLKQTNFVGYVLNKSSRFGLAALMNSEQV